MTDMTDFVRVVTSFCRDNWNSFVLHCGANDINIGNADRMLTLLTTIVKKNQVEQAGSATNQAAKAKQQSFNFGMDIQQCVQCGYQIGLYNNVTCPVCNAPLESTPNVK